MGRIITLLAGALIAYIGSGYLEGLLSNDGESDTDQNHNEEA